MLAPEMSKNASAKTSGPPSMGLPDPLNTLPNMSRETGVLRTSPVNSRVVLRLSMPEVPSKTCTTAREPSTSRTCPRRWVPSPRRTSTISANLGLFLFVWGFGFWGLVVGFLRKRVVGGGGEKGRRRRNPARREERAHRRGEAIEDSLLHALDDDERARDAGDGAVLCGVVVVRGCVCVSSRERGAGVRGGERRAGGGALLVVRSGTNAGWLTHSPRCGSTT
jgi:hypothetical protein